MPKKQMKKKSRKFSSPSKKKVSPRISPAKKPMKVSGRKVSKSPKKPILSPKKAKKPMIKKAALLVSKKAKLKKSIARKAVLKAVANRAAKPPKKKLALKAKAVKAPKLRKPPSKPKRRDDDEPASPPKARPLDKEEINRLLSDAYARHLVIEAGGEHALEIVRGFANNSSDEEISKKMKIKISDVRATLNKLHSLGIVEYTRHKDSETGWFSYFWCLNGERMKNWVNKKVEEERKNMDFSNGEHYFCPTCGGASIHAFTAASDLGFKCPSCGTALDFLSQEKAEELFPMKAFRKPLL